MHSHKTCHGSSLLLPRLLLVAVLVEATAAGQDSSVVRVLRLTTNRMNTRSTDSGSACRRSSYGTKRRSSNGANHRKVAPKENYTASCHGHHEKQQTKLMRTNCAQASSAVSPRIPPTTAVDAEPDPILGWLVPFAVVSLWLCEVSDSETLTMPSRTDC